MRSNARWDERIGAVFLPEADELELDDGEAPAGGPELTRISEMLKQGCSTVQHTPTGAGVFGSRFRGTSASSWPAPHPASRATSTGTG